MSRDLWVIIVASKVIGVMEQSRYDPMQSHAAQRGRTTILEGSYFDKDDAKEYIGESGKPSGWPYLVRLSSNERITQNKPVFRIGRERAQTDYCFDNTQVSRQHAKFTQNAGLIYIRDLHSRNGSYVNSERISANETIAIQHGDRIRLANEE